MVALGRITSMEGCSAEEPLREVLPQALQAPDLPLPSLADGEGLVALLKVKNVLPKKTLESLRWKRKGMERSEAHACQAQDPEVPQQLSHCPLEESPP